MNINEAIKVAIKCRNCALASAYNCSLIGCENCENDYDAMEYTDMLNVFIDYFNKCADETIDDFYFLLKNQLTIDALTCAKDKFTVLSIINRQYNNMKASLNHTRTEGDNNV